MPAPLTVLILGAGQIGAFYDTPDSPHVLTHAHAATLHDSFELLGFVEPNTEQAQRAAHCWSVPVYSSIAAAHAVHSAIDIIVIATPDATHEVLLEGILTWERLPRLVFAEKPLTLSPESTKAIANRFESVGIPLAVNYTRRFVPEYQALAQRLQEKAYGEFLGATGYYGKGLFHNGSHMLDLLDWFMGVDHETPVTVSETFVDYREADPTVSALIQSRCGQPIWLKAIPASRYTIFELDMMFDSARIRLPNGGLSICTETVIPFDMVPGYEVLGQPVIQPTQIPTALQHAYTALANHLNTQTPLPCSGTEAYQTLLLCQAIQTRYTQAIQVV